MDDGVIAGPVRHDAHRLGAVVGDANRGRELYPPSALGQTPHTNTRHDRLYANNVSSNTPPQLSR
eukprot:6112077-Lingulodinium_polyedra.AAC.1